MTVEIILARHGDTDWNTGEIFRGLADVGLSEAGKKQAELLGEYLSGEKIDFIYSGPLRRAVQTAEAIAGHHKLDVHVVQNLIDINYGEWQGVSLADVRKLYPDTYQDWLDTPEQVRIPGGESLEDVRSRALPFLEDAVMRCEEGKLVMVSHRVVNKVIICALLGLDNSCFWNVKLDTCAISRFEVNAGRFILTCHNDTSYLKSVRDLPPSDF